MYVVYMNMQHNTVNGKHLLAKVRVGQSESHHEAKGISFACMREPIGGRWYTVRKMVCEANPQAGAVHTTFDIAFEG